MSTKISKQRVEDTGFVSFARRLVCQLSQVGKYRTAERYSVVLNSFLCFLDGEELPWPEIDSQRMLGYEMYLKHRGVCPNTSSFYLRNLRAMYNRAVAQGFTVQQFPFRYVYTGVDKTLKRAVPIKVIRRIRNLDLSSQPVVEWARDLFLFSFYTRGMSFVDMAFLKKKDLRNGILSYRRQKTGQLLYIKWEPMMQAIVFKYETSDTPYLLPIIRNMSKDERRQYINASHLVNTKLKKIGKEIGLAIPLTMYVARHGWASIAKTQNVSVSVISEAMGHDSEKTTRIYLASLDTTAVDRANRAVLEAL